MHPAHLPFPPRARPVAWPLIPVPVGSGHRTASPAAAGPCLAALLLALVALAGCLAADDGDGMAATPFPLGVHRFAYPGSDVAVAGVDHGWLVRIDNPTMMTMRVSLVPFGVESVQIGPVDVTEGETPRPVWLSDTKSADQPSPSLTLAPGTSGIFLAQVKAYAAAEGSADVGFQVLALDVEDAATPYASHLEGWQVTLAPEATAAAPGDHVQTATIGVYRNGTSFYTNIEALDKDGNVTRDYPPEAFDATPLPVYVYDQSGGEQPPGSRDTCHFVTIRGYNELLKSQAEGSTNVRFLRPEDAYTRPGNEQHSLYGEPLIFLNTVVGHDGAAPAEQAAPDPRGACYCPENIVPRDVAWPPTTGPRPVCERLP